MSITYRHDPSLDVVLEEWCGPVSAEEVGRHWAERVADAPTLACSRILADLRTCQVRFTGDELRRMVKASLQPSKRNEPLRIAIVAANPLQYGVSRQFQAFHDEVIESAVFTDPAEALEWLLKRNTPWPTGLR